MGVQTVSLLSDWGTADYYVSVVKAKLYAYIPDVRIVDISHRVFRDDIYSAAFMMLNAYPYFPDDTSHIIGVNGIASVKTPHLVVRFENQWFIGADNGFFSALQVFTGKSLQEVYEIDLWQETDIYTFPGRDLFPKAAALLAAHRPMVEIGRPFTLNLKKLNYIGAQKTPEKDRFGRQIGIRLLGRVLYIDSFGNICTNITRSLYESCLKEYPVKDLYIGGQRIPFKLSKAYMDVEEGDFAFIFLENGFLEISINRGFASDYLGVDRPLYDNVDTPGIVGTVTPRMENVRNRPVAITFIPNLY